MRTTIDIPDALASEVKTLLAAQGRTLRDLVSEGLRLCLEKERARSQPFRLRRAAFSGTMGFAEGVTADSAVADLRDDPADRGPAAP